MSTVAALQFDPAFGMGSRSSYSTWPVLENNNSILGHDIPPSSSYGSDTSLSPPTGNRSISSNSRQAISLSAQQREIKRQREQARRDAKVTSRRRAESVASLSAVGLPPTGSTASVSTSSKTSPLMVASSSAATGSPLPLPPVTATSSPPSYMQSPPVTMADLSGVSSGPGSMPVGYATTSAPQISLLSEPVTTTSSASTSLAPPYYSPPLQDNSFSSSYQTQPCMSEYTTGGYTTAPPPPISSQYGRPMQEQPGLLYHMPQQQLPPPAPSMMGPGVQPPHGPLGHPHLVHPQAPRGHESMVPPSAQGAAPVRVVQSRPKPQCWEHGCNGRQFSTFSNLLRHQREKSGQATKAVCPNCGAEFTRTTARNGHLQHDKCKQRRNV